MFVKSILGLVAVVALACIPGNAQANIPGGGVHIHHDTVVAEGLDVYDVAFATGPGRVVVEGDHDTDLDCFLVTADGNETVIAKDDNLSDLCVIDFTVYSAGQLRVKVYNLGDVYNSYTIATR